MLKNMDPIKCEKQLIKSNICKKCPFVKWRKEPNYGLNVFRCCQLCLRVFVDVFWTKRLINNSTPSNKDANNKSQSDVLLSLRLI